MNAVVKPYPREFREDVVRVARNREPGVTMARIAKDFGIHEVTLSNWMRQADIEDGNRPGVTTAESLELRDARRRIRLLKPTLGGMTPVGARPGPGIHGCRIADQ